MPAVALSALQTLPAVARPPGNGASPPADGSAPGGFAKALQQANDRPAAPGRDEAADQEADAVEQNPAGKAPADNSDSTDSTDGTGGSTADAAPPTLTQAMSTPSSPPANGFPAWTPAVAADAARGPAPDTRAPASGSASEAGSSSLLASSLSAAPRSGAETLPAGMPHASAATPDREPETEGGPTGGAATAGAAMAGAVTAGAAPAPVQLDVLPAAPGIDASAALQTARPAAAAGPAGAAAALPTSADLHEPLHSPTFAPALGAQISVMLRDGISEARLHLNPAEMGPIAVRISVEGPSARVDMVAAHAQTRQVLEQSMPALAGALRESGLTLTGGGVFDQARDPRQAGADAGADGRSGRRGHADAAGDGGPAAGLGVARDAQRSFDRPRGMLDLYA